MRDHSGTGGTSTGGTSTGTRPRIKAFIAAFVRSEYLSNWQAERVQAGGYARSGSDDRDRYNRCYEAAEQGADGSTHYEVIQDWRDALRDCLRDRGRRTGKAFAEYPYRVEAAILEDFDRTEDWHDKNGTLHQEIG